MSVIRAPGAQVQFLEGERQPSSTDFSKEENCTHNRVLPGRIPALELILPIGFRNNGLTSYAGQLRARGLSRDEILQALREANQERCIPPLTDDRELRNIAKQAAKWAPHPTCDRWTRSVFIPRGCFDPRPNVCGFDPAALVNADTTLGLRHRHKAVYGFLAGRFGPFGCHPSQDTVAEALGMFRQQVTRDIKRLVIVGLIGVEPGAYRKAQQKHAANTYYFRKDRIFAAAFEGESSRLVNEIEDFSQQPSEGAIQSANQSVSDTYVALEPISASGGYFVRPRSAIPADPPGYWVTRYVECASGCGGCRVEYGDGTVKRYECSCDMPEVLEAAA